MNASHRAKIAERIRGLILGQDLGDLGSTARRLGVDEVSLRMSVDELSPYPTIDVIAAVVNHYGVDPSYLMNGKYDDRTHRQALTDPEATIEAIRSLAAEDGSPQTDPPVQRHLYLA